jgi:hypothetical protein
LTYLLGIDFSGNYIKLVEINNSYKKAILNKIDYIKTEVDFSNPRLYEDILDPEIAFKIVSSMTELLKRNQIHSNKVSISLPASTALILTLPIDKDLPTNKIKESLLWELPNYYPKREPDNFNIAYYTLNQGTDVNTALLVAINREIINFIKGMFSDLLLAVVQINIDHFAALRVTIAKAIERNRENYSLIGFRGDYLDIGKITNYSLSHYSGAFISQRDDNYLDIVESFLRTKIDEPCYFYGEQFTKTVIDSIVSNFNVKYYTILDPFQNIEVPRIIDIKKTFISNLSDFAFAVGSVIDTK